WATASGLEVIAISSPEELEATPKCVMVVVNVGGTSVLALEPQLAIKVARTVMADVPLVVLSDREDRNEICAAFNEGANGFISTNLEPSLAMEALTFVGRGGSFFPHSALLELAQPVRGETFDLMNEGAGAP